MQKLIDRLFNHRLRALIGKEFDQIRRDRRLAISLVLPPTLQLLLFGFALNATVTNVRLGIVDDCRTPESRELVATLTESKSFRASGYYFSVNQLGDALGRNELDAGVVVPYDYSRDLERGRPVTVQFLLNAMNANTAAIAQGYAEGVIQSYNQGLRSSGIHASFNTIGAPDISHQGRVLLTPAFLYNPGLRDSWFVVTGVFGILLMLNGSLISAVAMVKERETGTLEQLLMSPASPTEIIIAKMTPLFSLLCVMALFAMLTLKVVFQVPFRGSLVLVMAGAALCLLAGIGIGTCIATFSKTGKQAQLTAFFVNPPLTSLSGALTPVEAMPHWLQPFTLLDPIRHFGTISRAVLIKGSGIATLWPNFLALLIFTLALLSLSVWRFRNQLS